MADRTVLKADASDIGTYVDGHWGQYATAHMVEKATEWGYSDEQLESLAARHLASMGPSDEPGISDDEHEMLIYGSDKVENWLNDNTLPEGANFSWRWDDGEFGLYLDEEDEQSDSVSFWEDNA